MSKPPLPTVEISAFGDHFQAVVVERDGRLHPPISLFAGDSLEISDAGSPVFRVRLPGRRAAEAEADTPHVVG